MHPLSVQSVFKNAEAAGCGLTHSVSSRSSWAPDTSAGATYPNVAGIGVPNGLLVNTALMLFVMELVYVADTRTATTCACDILPIYVTDSHYVCMCFCLQTFRYQTGLAKVSHLLLRVAQYSDRCRAHQRRSGQRCLQVVACIFRLWVQVSSVVVQPLPKFVSARI
jgi:hypothetical protein